MPYAHRFPLALCIAALVGLMGCDAATLEDAPGTQRTEVQASTASEVLCPIPNGVLLSNNAYDWIEVEWNPMVDAHSLCPIEIQRQYATGSWTAVTSSPLVSGETSYVDASYTLKAKSPTIQYRVRAGSTGTWQYSSVETAGPPES